MAEPGLKLPAEIVSWMEEVTGAPVTKMDRVPGGASREAWFIDVIGDNLTEINVTSPTGIQEINRFDDACLEAGIWDAIEARL